jgi:hypothetical protein
MTKVTVGPETRSLTHDISLTDVHGSTWGFKLEKGARDIQEIPQTPSTVHFGGGGTKFGDWEPGFSHLEQRTWTGGRGLDDFSLDVTRFYDSLNAFTMLEDKCFPAPQWKFAKGIRTTHENLPGDVNWQALTGDERYVSSTFTVGGSNLSADNLEFWIRRIGSPGTLTAEVWTNSSGDPSVVVASATKTATVDEIIDWISELYTFDVSAASDLSSSTVYHVVLYGASTDDAANHWEVGVDNTGSASKKSTAGSSWSTATFSLYYRLSDTDIDRKWHFFAHLQQLYAVDQRADDGNSTLLMHGERGRATGSSNTTLVDSNNGEDGSWIDDQWNGWYVRIVKGKGKGQKRLITDTSAAGNSITVAKWDANPNTTSDYVIYGGDVWQEITLGNDALPSEVVRDTANWDGIVALALGDSNVLHFMRYNNGAHQGDIAPTASDKTKVDFVARGHDKVDGPVLWLAKDDTKKISRMKSFTWLSPANSDVGTAFKIGGLSWNITNMSPHGKLNIFKENGLYIVNNDRPKKLNVGLNFIRSENNGEMMVVHNTDLYFSWGGFSIQRLIGKSLASVGPDKGTGMPAGRSGRAVSAKSHPAGLFVCWNAEAGTSSLLFYNNARLGWHELFRAWGANKKVEKIRWQDNPLTNPKLWMSVNGDIVYQDWPKNTFNPLEDSTINYQHEFYVTLADMDMGVARLPKFFKEVTLITENLASGIEAHVEYQLDKNIGGTTWIQAGTVHNSPEQTVDIRRGNARRIRIRIRMLTNDASTPPILKATILEAFARTPLKYQWNMRVKIASNQKTKRSTPDHKPDDILTWLKNAAKQAEVLHMRSRWEQMDDIFVIVEPPNLMRSFANAIRKTWKGSVIFTVREA